MSIRLLLVDDHRMMRNGLRSILEHVSRFEVVGEAGTGREALKQVDKVAPDVVLMDVGMPDLNGIEATRQVTHDNPDVKVIALSMHADEQSVLEMLEAGASGYVIKMSASEELMRAIDAVSRGKRYLSPEVAGVVVDSYVGRLFPTDHSAYTTLGSRERQVLQLLAEGNTSKEIATSLNISPKTVDAHRRNIMKKLDLHSIAELTKYAIREGLTELS